ncbi:efflux RND transporter periplasmic adaptor subunit [Endozoicomonas sp. GU-1]|uniref:efflux RND transporter periplasmic adaptor subunit n=1 Tax=Endozoicomonas sp. GU-1 TaxID=3009078 RepID=UPI0022B32836|nr:efflux RND transporter periplasmic adaptor subunit [Endozoicomonas sp. GU-1]WBA83858.1 efflux RND transporter periplasmic adaptor subunit [Endozoicomonas sp. GU-1]WBA86836.1 efflux RND transporter periplasmic adaptor subunit [Endozoicomonas sp. GU-1]
MTASSLFTQPGLVLARAATTKSRAILLVALTCLAVFSQVASATAAKSQAPAVTAFPVTATTLQQSLMALGNLKANQSVDIAPQINGRIVALHLRDGVNVKSGQLLVELDDREQEAITAQARIAFEDAQRQLDYMEALINSKAISVEQLKAQRATVDRLEAALQAELAILDHYTLEAPFTGMLSFHEQSVGALVNAGTVLTTLDDLSTMKLTFDLPENTLGQISKGARVSATTDAWPGKTFTGTINSINPRIDPVNLTFQVRALLDNPESQLLPGMLMRTSIERPNQQQRLVVPSRSILYDGNRRYVFVIDEQNRVERRTITTGQTIDQFIVVVSGLVEGERVVNEGAVKVTDGRRVKVLEKGPSVLSANPVTPAAANGLL